MRRIHPGLLLVGAAVVVAVGIQLLLVRPLSDETAHLRKGLLDRKPGELEDRLRLAPEKDVTAIVTLDLRLEKLLPDASDPWEDFAEDGVRPPPGLFRGQFEAWLGRLQGDGVLERGAWPSSPWREGRARPSRDEMDATARAALLVQDLGEGLRDGAGGLVTSVVLPAEANEIEVVVELDPERAGGLIEVLSRESLGAGPFELVSLDSQVPETGPARAAIRLRFLGIEP